MKKFLSFTALGAAITACMPAAHAQTAPLAPTIATTPVETVETVRTVQTTTAPRRRIVREPGRVTTTRTTVSERIVPGRPLYDVVTTPPVVAPYRYVYEPGRILVIDPYTNVAVQAIPR